MRRVVALVPVAVLVFAATGTASASPCGTPPVDTCGLQITTNGGSPVDISETEVGQALFPAVAAELVGVDPANLQTMNAMTISNANPPNPSNEDVLTQTEVVAGYGTPPQQVLGEFSFGTSTSVTAYSAPSFAPTITSATAGDLYVNLAVSGNALGVPPPVINGSATPMVGQTVQFTEPGPISSDVFNPSALPDTNGLMYSWDFGDGTPPTAPSASASASHAYTTATTFPVTVTVTDAASNGGVSPPAPSPQVLSVTVAQVPQSISFPQLGPFTFGQAPVVLPATASSGLPIAYSVVSGPCSLSGVTLTFTGPGSCAISANQFGDDMYAAANPVTSVIAIAPTPTPPVCTDQSISTANGAATTVTLGCADATGDGGDALTFAIANPPAHGTLSGLDPATGAVTYTPAGTYSGPDSFTFAAMDAQGIAAAATVSVTVAPPQAPPSPGPPMATGPPAISGTAALGATLACSRGVWSGAAPLAYSFQWKRDGVPLAGATKASYVTVIADAGHRLTCAVTATNAAGSAVAQSAPISIPLASNAFTLVRLSAARSGLIAVKLEAPDAGGFAAAATLAATGATKKRGRGAKQTKPTANTYGTRSARARGRGTLTLTISPTKRAAQLLKKQGHLRVSVSVTFTPTGGKRRTRTAIITVN